MVESAEIQVGVVENDWMRKWFTNVEPHAPFCSALQRVDANGNLDPDYSVCPKKGKKSTKGAMMKSANKAKYGAITFHMMQGGDKWNNGKLWSNDKLDRAIKKA
jgi:hypothetical protein